MSTWQGTWQADWFAEWFGPDQTAEGSLSASLGGAGQVAATLTATSVEIPVTGVGGWVPGIAYRTPRPVRTRQISATLAGSSSLQAELGTTPWALTPEGIEEEELLLLLAV